MNTNSWKPTMQPTKNTRTRSTSKERAYKGPLLTGERILSAGRADTNDNLILRVALCKSARDDFSPVDITWLVFAQTLGKHIEREKKDGLAAIFADIREFRKDAYVQSVSALAFEIDGRLTIDDVKSRVAASGKEALVWTTHNHLRTRQRVGLATFNKWQKRTLDIDGPPTNETVSQFCAQNKRYSHLSGVCLADTRGAYAVREYRRKVFVFDIAHDPEHKTRIVFPLSQPIPLKDGTRTIADFKAIYHAHGRSVFGDAYSTESQNPARLHYLPSHPPGKLGQTYRFEGDAVNPSEIWITNDPAVRVEPKSRAAGSRSAAMPIPSAQVAIMVSGKRRR